MPQPQCPPSLRVLTVTLATPLFPQAARKMEKELRVQIERLQEDKNYNDQMYREVGARQPQRWGAGSGRGGGTYMAVICTGIF